MQHDTERLRTEGGLWFLQDKRFIEWENNAGMLWIEGPSGAGKSVLSSTVIQKLFADRSLFTDETKTPPAVAFFYFNFRDKHAQNVEIMLRRIVLQLSAASPHPYRILNDQYQVSNGQRLLSYQNLVEILKQLLQDLGRTYIVLDALDECDSTGFNQLVNLVATLRLWMETPLHVLLTSQTHSIFTTGFKGIPEIPLEFELQQADIRHFLASEFETNSDLAAWKSQQAKVMDGIVRKSNGMFRLASCLLHALASCLYGEPEELDETLKSLPNDLVTIYNRFMEAIPQKYLIYIEAALRWILFTSHQPLYLVQLADAISFDFMPEEYTYTPSRRAGNEGLILKWLGGLVVVRDIIDFMDRHLRVVTLAHASVQDYLFSHHFKNKFSSDLLEGISHVFLFKTCISYLLYFGHHPLPDDSEYEDTVKYPLLHYAATEWYHHLSYSHNREALLPMALQVLEAGSQPYCILLLSTADEWDLDPPPLHHCCRKGYIDCVRCLVGNGVNLNRAHINLVSGDYGTALAAASFWGEVEIVHLLLENGANVNLVCGRFGSALATASFMHNAEIARLLLEKGADVNLVGGQYGSALAMASHSREPKIVRLLLENGANVNLAGGEYGSALVTVCASPGYSNETPRPAIQIVRLLLENGADLKSQGTRALEEALKMWHEDIVALLHRQLDGVVSDTEDHMDEEETSSASDSE
ncbi:hypothetical protein B0H14DRAFT_2852446 [Mycena olivaceomarginata]|nr:hypothetical protein B0H14DRAFT_2852446 [Mycena olivaceomarginata]